MGRRHCPFSGSGVRRLRTQDSGHSGLRSQETQDHQVVIEIFRQYLKNQTIIILYKIQTKPFQICMSTLSSDGPLICSGLNPTLMMMRGNYLIGYEKTNVLWKMQVSYL